MMTKNDMIKKTTQYIVLLLLIGITMKMVFNTLDIKTLSNVLKIVDKNFVILGLISISLYVYLEGIVIEILVDGTHKIKSKFLGLKLATMSFYYNLVTPFSAGSQPVLIYTLTKHKMPLSKASAVVTNKTLLYQFVVTLYCLVFIIANSKGLITSMPQLFLFSLLGVTINAFVLIIAFLIVLNPLRIIKVANFLISKMKRYKVLNFITSKMSRVEEFVLEYSSVVTNMFKNKKVLVLSLLVTIIQLTIYFSISFWIYKAFNLSGYSFMYLLTLQVFLYMVVSPMPTPGNVGANELVFFKVFASVFPKSIIGYAVLLYSGFIYYLLLIGSGIFTLITHIRMKKSNNIDKSKGILESKV